MSRTVISLQIHIIAWRNFENIHRKMFFQTNHIKQDSTKNYLAFAKPNRVSKYALSVQKL